jgi:dTDP-glucose 4,6-dehydratase
MEVIRSKKKGYYRKFITFVKDRPGHDLRYAINCDKIRRDLEWEPQVNFNEGLDLTIHWYTNNKKWIENIKSGLYRKWIELNYGKRDFSLK